MSWLLREVEREQHREVKATVCRSEMSEHAISRGSPASSPSDRRGGREQRLNTTSVPATNTAPSRGALAAEPAGGSEPLGGLTVPATHTGNGFLGRTALPPSSWHRLHCSANTAAPQRCPQDTHTHSGGRASALLCPQLFCPPLPPASSEGRRVCARWDHNAGSANLSHAGTSLHLHPDGSPS